MKNASPGRKEISNLQLVFRLQVTCPIPHGFIEKNKALDIARTPSQIILEN